MYCSFYLKCTVVFIMLFYFIVNRSISDTGTRELTKTYNFINETESYKYEVNKGYLVLI